MNYIKRFWNGDISLVISYWVIGCLLNIIVSFIIGFVWSYSFQILSEIRHWFWDLGYGFELKTSKITGMLVIIGSIVVTIILYSTRGNLL